MLEIIIATMIISAGFIFQSEWMKHKEKLERIRKGEEDDY